MIQISKMNRALKATIAGVVVFAMALFGAAPAYAAGFVPTGAATNTDGTVISVHHSVALDAARSTATTADYTIRVNGTARATNTYTLGYSSNDVVLTLTSAPIVYGNTVTVSYNAGGGRKTYQAGGGNTTLSTYTNLAVTNAVPAPDTTAPTLTSAATNTAGTAINLVYNEALLTSSIPSASAYDITQDGATIPSANYSVGVAGSTVTITFTSALIVNATRVVMNYTPGATPVKDLAGNAAAAVTNNVVSNIVPDTTAPRVIGRVTNTAGTLVTIQFNEPLSTTNVPDSADFWLRVNGNTYPSNQISVDITDSVVNLHLTGTPIIFGDSLFIDYTHNVLTSKQIQDVAHNIGNSTNNEQVQNLVPDLGAPLIDGRQTNAAGDRVTMHYSYPLLATSVPASNEYAFTVNSSPYTNFTVSIDGSDVVLILGGAAIANGDVLSISYSGTSLKRASNSISAATFSNLAVDNLVPAPGAPYVLNGETSVDGAYVYINMNKPMNTSQVPLASDFFVEFDSQPYSGTFTVAVSGSQVILHLSNPAAFLTYVEVGYTPGLAANRLKSLDDGEALAWIDLDVQNQVPDTTAPTVVSRVTNSAGTQLIITFSEQLCETCLPDTSDLYLVFDGTRYSPSDYSMSISGATYTFTLTGAPITFGQILRLSYVPNSVVAKRVQDIAGNLLPPTNNAVITNMVSSTGAPVVTSKTVNPAGTAVTVAFDLPLDSASVPAASEFVLKVNGSVYANTDYSVSISGTSVILTLTGAPIASGATVLLSYAGSSIKASGIAAAHFTDNTVATVVRPELVTLATDTTVGRHIYLTYNLPLNASSIPAATDFTLTVNGVVYSSSNITVSVTGSSVVIDLLLTGAAIKQTDVVRLVYTPGGSPIEDTAGNDAAALPLTVVSNRVPDTTAPENISFTTNLLGDELIWTYNEPLNPARVPLATDLVITVNGLVYATPEYTVSVDDSRMVVHLNGERVRFGQTVLVAYTPGLDANKLADPAGNVVQEEPHATVLNQVSSTAVPTVTSMATNTAGNQVVITYNKTLDATSVPLVNDFIFSLNDVVYSSSNISVAVSGSSVILTLTGAPATNGVRVNLQYIRGLNKIKDLSGNYADSFEKTRVTNNVPDTTAPVVISRTSNSAGNLILITFSEPLNEAKLPAPSDIALVFDGVRYDPANYTVSISGSVFTFTLTGPAIHFGQALRLSYTRDLATPEHWVQDLAGNLVNNSVSQTVDNLVPDTAAPVLVSAVTSVLGDQITLTYNYPLATGSVPLASNFVLHVGGSVYSNADYTVSVIGSTVVLTLTGSPIEHGSIVTLSYSGTAIKRSANNVSAATFTNLSVSNNVPDATAPVILLRDEITIHLGDTAVTRATADDHVTWSESLDDSGYFSVDSSTGVITASSAAPLGTYEYTVTATNDAGLQTDATITIVVRPVPIVASNGGDKQTPAPLPPLATALAPVTGVTTPVAETKVVATIETPLGLRVVSVLEPVGAVPAGATIAIQPGPSADESSDGRYTIDVTVTGKTGEDISEFSKTFTLNMGQYVSGTIPAHSADGISWPALPKLQGDWLPAGAHDGYYIDAQGNLIILTRHMTFFGLKKDQEMVHELRILTGPTRTVVGGEFNFRLQGGLGAGKVMIDNHTPEICRIIDADSVLALKAGVCQIHTTKLGDGVYADADSDNLQLLIEDPSAKMRVYGSIKLLRVDLGPVYAGKTVSIMMSTPSVHPFTLYRKVTLDEDGVKEIRAGFDSHATFRIVYGKKIVVDAKAND